MTKIIATLDEIDPGYTRALLRPLGLPARRGAGVPGGGGGARAVPGARRGGGADHQLAAPGARGGAPARRPRRAAVLLRPGGLLRATRRRRRCSAGMFGRRVYHIGPERDLAFFRDAAGRPLDVERVPLEEAEGIVCTGLFDDRTETPGRLPRDHPLRQDQGAEAALRQPRHRGRRRRPAHLLRRRHRRGLYRGGRAELLLRQALSADLRPGARPARRCRPASRSRTRSSPSATASPPTSRARSARASTRSSSPAASPRPRPAPPPPGPTRSGSPPSWRRPGCRRPLAMAYCANRRAI